MDTARFIKDQKSGRYIVYAPGRVKRPDEMQEQHKDKACPFCGEFGGNAGAVKFEVKDEQGNWKIRSIDNKFPITPHHEVIIHSPNHDLTLDKMDEESIGQLFKVYKERFNDLKQFGQVLIFCNYGKMAGASLEHPHSQIMVVEEGVEFSSVGVQSVSNLIFSTQNFDVYAPDYSAYPYEVWVKPKIGGKCFGDEDDERLIELGSVAKKVLSILITHLSNKDLSQRHSGVPHLTWKDDGIAYNFYIDHGNDYFLRIVPKLQVHAGFEIGSGIYVNVVEPSEVANLLKEDNLIS